MAFDLPWYWTVIGYKCLTLTNIFPVDLPLSRPLFIVQRNLDLPSSQTLWKFQLDGLSHSREIAENIFKERRPYLHSVFWFTRVHVSLKKENLEKKTL